MFTSYFYRGKHRREDNYVGKHRRMSKWPHRVVALSAVAVVFGAYLSVVRESIPTSESSAGSSMAVMVIPRESARLHLPVDEAPESTETAEPSSPEVTTPESRSKPPATTRTTATAVRRAPTSKVALSPGPHAVVATVAKSLVNSGLRYCWGGKDLSVCVDCSGFVWNVFKRAGLGVPYRSSAALASWSIPISKSQAQPGDLVLYYGHVGIYMGNNMMVDHGSTPGAKFREIYGAPRFGRIP